MRLAVRMLAAAVAALAGLAGGVGLGPPALAKGIESATITGPGLTRPIEVSGPATGKLPALAAVWEVTPGHPEPVPLLDRAPTRQLGPGYTIGWRILAGELRQEVYPHASGGPLVHTAAGQAIHGGVTAGGWYQAHVALRDMLYMLGMPPVGVVTPSEAAVTGGTSLTVTGPAIRLDAPVEVSGATLPDEWARIDTGLHAALPGPGPSALAAEPPAARHGLRHTLTWHVMTGRGDTVPVRQDLYLYADGGPLVYTAPGQPIWGGVTRGGWYHASDDVRQALADACVPIIGDFGASKVCWERRWAAKAASAGKAPSAGTVAAVGNAPSVAVAGPVGDPWWPEAVAGLSAASAVAGVTGAVAVRVRRARRRDRVAPVPL